MKTLWHESIDDIADIINSGATVKNDALYNLMEDIQCLMEELETMSAENAKLIAERDEMYKKLEDQDDHCKVLSMHIDDLKADNSKILKDKEFENITLNSMVDRYQFERDSLLAEREAMMKQEHASDAERLIARNKCIEWCKGLSVSASNSLINAGINSKTKLIEFIESGADLKNIAGIGEKIKSEILDWVTYPLPAQQIPEGYVLDSERLNFLAQRGARVGWGRDGEKCAVYGNEPDEFNTLIRYNGSKCFDDPREAIDHAMLSASQPKGDV